MRAKHLPEGEAPIIPRILTDHTAHGYGMQQTDRQGLVAELARAAHIWLLQPESVTDSGRLADSAVILSPEETDVYHRFRFDADRHLYLVSHAMLRRVLSVYADVDPAAWGFSRNSDGRPEVVRPALTLPLRFNLSHTRGLVACVVTLTVDCGIDAEEITSRRNCKATAERMFADIEQQALQELDGQALLEQFFTYWTLREAFCKCQGNGLANSGRHFWFEPGVDGGWSVRFGENLPVASGWQLAVQHLYATHVIAVAVNTGAGVSTVFKFRDFNF